MLGRACRPTTIVPRVDRSALLMPRAMPSVVPAASEMPKPSAIRRRLIRTARGMDPSLNPAPRVRRTMLGLGSMYGGQSPSLPASSQRPINAKKKRAFLKLSRTRSAPFRRK